MKTAKTPKIYAYGFDKARFQIPKELIKTDEYTLHFLNYDSEESLDTADGLIIPSGIFETIETHSEYFNRHAPEQTCSFDKVRLPVREKQLLNAEGKKGWWCVFLLEDINNGIRNDFRHTDLAKKYLNYFAQYLKIISPNPSATCKTDEFRDYWKHFGIFQTYFDLKKGENSKIIGELSSNVVSFETEGKFFFLPFHTDKKTSTILENAVKLVTQGVLEYKRKNQIQVPAWLNEQIEFENERANKKELQEIHNRLNQLRQESETWERYKAVLCTSGDHLHTIVVEILRDFFVLRVESVEKFKEDALIFEDQGKPQIVVEIKGVNSGVKREHINQVDTHREQLEIPPETSGILIINDFMDQTGFENRKKQIVAPEQLSHAKTHNVKILRTVTLLEILLSLEKITPPERKTRFFELVDQANPLFVV